MEDAASVLLSSESDDLAVDIRGLSYRYRGQKRWALQAVDLQIQRGGFVVVMGPSEAGKSTLAACLNGLVPHFHRGKLHGQVTVLGHDTRTHTVAEMAERVGLVFQDFESQLFSTNVALEVAFGPENLAVPWDEMHARVQRSLQLVGLQGMERRTPASLSGGQKQKLAIASVLAMEPKVLCMDEPTTDLDPISKLGIFAIADELRRAHDITLIIIEHETEEALKAQRIVLMKQGAIVLDGPAADVLRRVELMQSIGVQPLQVPHYFHAAGADYLPLTVEEGEQEFRRRGWHIDEQTYAALQHGDAARRQSYGEPLIQVQGLSYVYGGEVPALNGVDLEIRRGEFLAVVGQNGSGKTTLVKHFNGLLMPTKGKVLVNGQETSAQGIYKLGRQVAYVFQNPDHQIFSQTVFDEVAFSPRIRGCSEAELKERVEEALEAVGLLGMEMEDPFSLTKGGRQRVAVASVLSARPDVIILDEPTTGLDYAEQRSMMDLVSRLNAQGHTIIFVTHCMWVVAEYAHRVVVMKDGRVLVQGPVREVLAQEDLLRESFLAPPQIVSLSNRLGRTLLSVSEMVQCTRKDG
ncbi:MAG: ABC transporter ATP-binding protein [Anaerolineae bacterium]